MKTNQFQTDRLLEFIKDYLPNVAKMNRQLNSKEAGKLIEDYGYNAVVDQLEKMDNYKPLRKKNESAYLTCKKWFKMDIDKGYFTPPKQAVKEPGEVDEREEFVKGFLKKHPIGSGLYVKGQKCTVENEIYLRSKEGLFPIKSLFNKSIGGLDD